MEDTFQNEKQLELTENIKNDLMSSAKWGKFLAIVGYVSMGILAIIGLFFLFRNAPYFNQTALMNLPLRFAGVIYLIMAVVYYFPITYLYRFSARVKEAVLSTDQDSLTESFYNLNKLFTFMGILTIIILILYGLTMLITIPMLFFIQH